ncbi:DNA adenine methylase [Hoeflea poritis]|uniref:DNA adenine methylase n=1 Tax=Hoeflea poritis TaxID=2993659 RepID=A0ABT4VPB7_9HYPH|nr:DNA adenine methylase [Hoeflea poritis]MDA4845917.1 DNA adenine methylase [Hoeflea poritis]
MNAPSRPVVRWHGGKWLLAPWIIDHFPKHRCYVEPFGGGGSVLLRKQRSHVEVWNDIDGEIVNLFEVLRSDRAKDLIRAVALTPYARVEFNRAYQPCDDSFERARRMVVRCAMGFGSGSNLENSSGFRSNSNRAGTGPANDWRNLPKGLSEVVDRLRGVVIENKDALDLMGQHDSPTTLHYCDPPYLHSTRDRKDARSRPRHQYSFEYSDDDHGRLIDFLHGVEGMVLISGYRSPLYDDLLADWHRLERDAHTGGERRVEVLWINPLAWDRLTAEHMPLFGETRTG